MRHRSGFAVVAIAAAMILAACATTGQVEDLEARIAELEQAATTTTRDITGTLTTWLNPSRNVCISRNDPIQEGDEITLHDGSDATLAIDWLSNKTKNDNENECTFTFTFPDVPTDQGFYRIRTGNIYWSANRADLEAADWTVEVTTRE